MKILHLHPEMKIPFGITKTIHYIIKYKEENSFHYLFTKNNKIPELFDNYCEKIFISSNKRIGLGTFLIDVIIIAKLCNLHNIDILHSHHRYFDFVAFFVKKISKVKTICTVHSKVTGKKMISYNSDLLIAVGDTIRKHLVEYFKIDSLRIKTINNFVDPSSYEIHTEKELLKKELKISNIDNIFLFVGRFDKEKAVDILINSFEMLIKINENCVLLIIGSGEEEIQIRNAIKTKNLPIKIIKPTLHIFDYYNISDYVILPSRVDPFPLTVLETGLAGKPFIGTKVDGIAEIIENNKDGILVVKENCEELYKGMDYAIKNKAKMDQLAFNLHIKICNNYTIDKILPQYYIQYNSLINTR